MRHLWLCAECMKTISKKSAPLADTMVDGTMLCQKHAREYQKAEENDNR